MLFQKTRHILWLTLIGLSLLLPAGSAIGGKNRCLQVTATAYNSLPGQTSGNPSIAAWGHRLKPGMKVIAVSPDLLRKGLTRGTKVKIVGLSGKYRVLDKTNKRFKRRIDIYMGKNVRAARKWGKRRVRIKW
ncbi:MAG: 3D domain-containing protein [Thiomargarita sp.]|nr:3D domain-containing protein [Thiomargarita sp.]